jgi:shikimate dehydrogenase
VNCEQTIAGQRILILGAGGAARGLMAPILAEEPAELVLANRTLGRAETLAGEFDETDVLSVCSFDDLAAAGEFDIVINATSAGLKGEQPPFPDDLVQSSTFCYDLAYSLGSTPFVSWAEARGAGRAVQGWGMLVEQAAESYRIWRGKRPDTQPILAKLAGFNA